MNDRILSIVGEAGVMDALRELAKELTESEILNSFRPVLGEDAPSAEKMSLKMQEVSGFSRGVETFVRVLDQIANPPQPEEAESNALLHRPGSGSLSV